MSQEVYISIRNTKQNISWNNLRNINQNDLLIS